MTKWLLYLLFTPLLTPQEKQTVRQYYREQRRAFVARHLIADAPDCVEELERKLDEEEGR